MERYWKDGFYDYEVEGGIEITEEHYFELLNGQNEGKMIVEDDTGYPILVEYPQLTEVESANIRINELKIYLSSTDKYSVKCYDLGLKLSDEYPEIYTKRVAARTEINELETLIK